MTIGMGRARRSGKVNVVVLVVGLLVAIPLVAVLWNGFRYDPRDIASPLIGKAAPDFTLTPLDGGDAVSLSALRGTPVVVNFWATWCVPCQAEHPTLLQLAKNYDGRVKFLGVVYQDEAENIQKWLAKRGSVYPQLIDLGSSAAIAFGVYGVPETYFIGKDGIIADKVTGAVDGRAATTLLDTLVAR